MKKENIEGLQWFVDFANLDLETIKPGDKAKLLIEAEENLWPKKEFEEVSPFLPPGILSTEAPPSVWTEPLNGRVVGGGGMGFLVPEICEFLKWKEIPYRETKEYWDIIVRLKEKVRHIFLDTGYDIGISRGWNISGKSDRQYPQMVVQKDMMLWWAVKGYKVPYKLKVIPLTKSQEDYLNLKILTLLDGFPGHAISVCPGCKKFFLNPTEREKRFCGEKCMRRVITAERRQADKEKYNEYQAKLMRDRYREKNGYKRKHTKARKPKAQSEPLKQEKPKAIRLNTKKEKRKEG